MFDTRDLTDMSKRVLDCSDASFQMATYRLQLFVTLRRYFIVFILLYVWLSYKIETCDFLDNQ